MTYRAPTPPPTPPENAEIAAYEAQLVRRVKRKRLITALVIGGLAIVGLGSCVGPLGVTLAQEAWSRRRTKLAPEEQRRVQNLLGPIEESAKKSQAAFEALWPKIRDSEIGARSDLGPCRVNVPGPRLRTKEESRSLEDSAEAYGWTFVDLTPSEARSPIALLKMPQGSIALNNTGTGERFSLGDKPLRLATPDRAPLLASTSDGERATALREESEQGLRADQRESYLSRVTSFADHAMPIDVIVFLDAWEEPKLTSEVKEPPPPKTTSKRSPTQRRAPLASSRRGSRRPTRSRGIRRSKRSPARPRR